MLLGERGVDLKIERIRRDAAAREASRRGRTSAPRSGLLPIVWVGIGLSVFQQFVGINVIFYYSNVLWQAVGFSEDDSFVDHGDHVGGQHRDHA